MIVAGTSPFIYIDLGEDEPGMILQRLEGREWRDCKVKSKQVKSPIDVNSLPPGRYRLFRFPSIVLSIFAIDLTCFLQDPGLSPILFKQGLSATDGL